MKLRTLLIAAATAAFTTGASAESLKVGMITTLSGGGAGLGIDVRDGFMLAINQANRSDIEVIVEDDQRKPDVAVKLADRMIQSDKVDVMTGLIFSNLAMAVVPSALAQGKFYLSPNAGPSQLAGRGCHKNYFNLAFQNDNLHEGAGAFMFSNGYKKPFIMAPNYPAGTDALNGFKRTYVEQFGGAIQQEIFTQLGQTDYAAEIAQIRASGADSLYFFLPGGMGISFLKQFAESGLDVAVVGPAFSFDQGILQAVGDVALGIRNTSQWSKDLDNAANVDFVASFQEAYGRLPSLYASQGYDTARLIISAMDKASVSDPDAFRAALLDADFESTRGEFRFTSNQHPFQKIYVREVIKEGDVLTNKIVGTALEAYGNAFEADCSL